LLRARKLDFKSARAEVYSIVIGGSIIAAKPTSMQRLLRADVTVRRSRKDSDDWHPSLVSNRAQYELFLSNR
jgi:hypothetical protein